MQKEGVLDLMCPNHGEKIISVQLTNNGENQMYCLKCLTQKQIPIEQLAQQLTNLRSQKIKNLQEQESQCEKRLGQLRKIFITIKEQFNKKVDNIIMNINDGILQINQNIKKEIELLKLPIQQLNITQLNNNVAELKKLQQLNDDLFFKNAQQLNNRIIQEYLQFFEQLNQQIKLCSLQSNNQDSRKNVSNEKTKRKTKKIQGNKDQQTEYKLLNKITGMSMCFALTMDKDQKILIHGENNNIQICGFNQDGTLIQKETLSGHTETVRSLIFSQKELQFISGSRDKSMRIWKKQHDDQWICLQILEEAHKDWVIDIIMNNDEDQFISCSLDKTIKVWMKDIVGIKWRCIQTLTEHTNGVRFLSFNPECNLLASSGEDGLRIWEKNQNKMWKYKQIIDKPKNDQHLRIKFIDKNELIASTKKQGSMLRYTLNNDGLFQLQSELKLNQIEEQDTYCFPIIYNKLQGFIILRHSNEFTHILKKNDNDEFKIHQVIKGNYKAGQMIKDGKYLILWNYQTSQLEIFKGFIYKHY